MEYKEFNVHTLSRKLIGNIRPIGSTDVDHNRLPNLEAHIALIEDLIFDLKAAENETSVGLASVDKSNARIKKALGDLEAMIKGEY